MGDVPNTLEIGYRRLIVQSCVWDSSLKYPSPACLHILCHVLILFTSQQLPVHLDRKLLQNMYWGQTKAKFFLQYLQLFTYLCPSLTVKSQNTPDRARQVCPHKQDTSIHYPFAALRLHPMLSRRLSLTLLTVGSDTTCYVCLEHIYTDF